jgi:arrestin-related trafficking adapter 4/5/7
MSLLSDQAGRHIFPFQLELSSSLPASMICEHACASVYYKLRATAVRPVFSANFHAAKPFWLIKGLSPEAMEYTQTLEIEVRALSTGESGIILNTSTH